MDGGEAAFRALQQRLAVIQLLQNSLNGFPFLMRKIGEALHSAERLTQHSEFTLRSELSLCLSDAVQMVTKTFPTLVDYSFFGRIN
jgi:hypothetical protein